MNITDITMSEWEGYQRKDFRLDGHDCLLILPHKEYPGKPWVWRAEFFGAFDYADRALLEKGWHIAYMGISDLYGCPESIDMMEQFYEYMIQQEGLNSRADLFGFSRGGLYAVNFSVGNPQAVSTLYLDAPVLDVTSWPGGYGASERYPKEWEECKAVYHLTEESAREFHGNPLDKMDQLLTGNIRIMLVAGEKDRVVPYPENGAKLADHYRKKGGKIRVILKPECDHHPHSLEAPSPIVQFIEENFREWNGSIGKEIHMNSKERFYATVERRPVDRPACWLGDPTPDAVPALCEYYHVKDIKELKRVCGDDFYAVEIPYHSETCNAIFAAFDWYMNGSNVDTEHRTLTADGCFAKCEDLDDVIAVDFPWPDPEKYIDPEECKRLVDEAPEDKVVMGMLWACHFQDVCASFGMQTCLMNMISDPEMVHYVDDHIVDFYLKALKIFLEATKGKVQAILIGDDVGSQRGLMISPALIEEFVIPGAKKLIELAHSYGVKVVYHSCGSIVEAIPLLIEAGVDVIHPIQALAAGMDPANLKAKFEGQISFCGGVDTQDLLPHGTPEMVAAKVKELRGYFPTGLIISPSHEGLQADVPPANIKALFDEANKIYD